VQYWVASIAACSNYLCCRGLQQHHLHLLLHTCIPPKTCQALLPGRRFYSVHISPLSSLCRLHHNLKYGRGGSVRLHLLRAITSAEVQNQMQLLINTSPFEDGFAISLTSNAEVASPVFINAITFIKKFS